jgi:uncharacterized membrane protein YeiH
VQHSSHYAVAALIGAAVVGIGGGMVRDVLVSEIPTTIASSPDFGAITGAVLCFGLRFIAMERGWQLPIARPPE